MKVIFLDFDGVLVNRKSIASMYQGEYDYCGKGPLSLGWHPADMDCVAVLNRLIESTEAKIVISSQWRLGFNICDLRELVNDEWGVVGEIIGKTPCFPNGGRVRGHEIQRWLDEWHSCGNEDVEAFVILDDMVDMAHLGDYLVKTVPQWGLCDKDYYKAMRILGAYKEYEACAD